MKGAEPKTPLLPTTLPELGAWQVFADQLTERGDRLGPYLALELSLGAELTKEQLTVFHKRALRICRLPRSMWGTWMLGHVRSLTITRDATKPLPFADGDDMLTLRDVLMTPPLRQVERLVLAAHPSDLRKRWSDAVSRLPPSCRCLELQAFLHQESDATDLLERIPAQFEVLRLVPRTQLDPALLVSDQFKWLDLRSIVLTPELARRLSRALDKTSRVQLRMGSTTHRSALESLGARAIFGDAEDAALIEEARDGAISLFERTSLAELQLRYGIVNARAQLLRELPEKYRIGRSGRGLGETTSWTGDAVLHRDVTGWAVSGTMDPFVQLNGKLVTLDSAPLKTGDRLQLAERSFRFVGRVGVPTGG